MTATQQARAPLGLRAGDLVQVRSIEEIMATLDDRGELENLPFMPEMVRFCGRRMRVRKVADRLCDTINRTGMRRMTNAVHLVDARCDGSAHGGCQTACTLYFKEQWLQRVPPAEVRAGEPDGAPGVGGATDGNRIDLPLLVRNTRRSPDGDDDGEVRYSCQATELLRAAPRPLPFRELSSFVDSVREGNATPYEASRAFGVGLFNRLQHGSERLPKKLRFRDGLPWQFLSGKASGRTPAQTLDLQPGELVRIKSKEEILATLDGDLLNRGMGFDAEMARFCGRTARVQARVDRCIDEPTGRMLTMKSPCIVLEGLVCEGAYSMNCPRAFVPFWREIWLERV